MWEILREYERVGVALERGLPHGRRLARVRVPASHRVRRGGRHAIGVGADGTIDLSPSGRLFIKESGIIVALYKGIQALLVEEKKAGAEAAGDEGYADFGGTGEEEDGGDNMVDPGPYG